MKILIGIVIMSTISTIIRLIILDYIHISQDEEDIITVISLGPAAWILTSIFGIIKLVTVKVHRYKYKGLLQTKDGKYWYCNSNIWDIVWKDNNKYTVPPSDTLQEYIQYWNKDYYEAYWGANRRYTPRIVLKKLNAKPVPKAEIRVAKRVWK